MNTEDKTHFKYIELFLQMIDLYNFDLHYSGDVFFVYDRQRGNLGDIESESFNNLTQLCERMEAYHNDYLYRAVEEDYELSIWDLAAIYLVENSYNLECCTVKEFKEYIDDKKLDNKDYEMLYKVTPKYRYDDNHSLSYWNGEDAVTVHSKYGTFDIHAIGDVRATLYAKEDYKDVFGNAYKKGEEVARVVDKNNSGRFMEEFGEHIRGDRHLISLLSDEDKLLNLEIGNNNWLVLEYTDNNENTEVIEDYDSLDIEDAIKYIEEQINYKEMNPEFKIFVDEIKDKEQDYNV